ITLTSRPDYPDEMAVRGPRALVRHLAHRSTELPSSRGPARGPGLFEPAPRVRTSWSATG
ncbi:MAG: hypothetical protein ABSE77_14345, partial [Acidimicrobiales bacterium]